MNTQDLPSSPLLAFERQRAAASNQPGPPWAVRAERLRRLQHLLLDNEASIARAIDADFGGRPAIEAVSRTGSNGTRSDVPRSAWSARTRHRL